MESQHFSNIKGVKALNGNVILEVYKKLEGKHLDLSQPVITRILSIEEARERAEVLVVMAARMDRREDAKVMLDIVKDIIKASEEACKQRRKLDRPVEGKFI